MQPAEIIDYLTQLPRFYIIALFPVSDTAWLTLPFNRADAAQRGWPAGCPRPVHLIRHRLESFDVAIARSMGGVLLYDDIDERLGLTSRGDLLRQCLRSGGNPLPQNADFTNAYNILIDRLAQQRQEQAAAEAVQASLSLEGSIRQQLDFVGATLVNWEGGQTIKITYEYNGMQRTVEVGRDFRTLSAGICLDGTDSRYDLASVITVLEEARRLHRFDLPEEDWL